MTARAGVPDGETDAASAHGASGHRVRLLAGSLCILVVSLTPSAPTAAGSLPDCRRADAAGPSWIFSGAWGGDGSLLLLAPRERSLARFVPVDGRVMRRGLPSELPSFLDLFAPTSVWPLDKGGVVLESEGFHLLELDERLRPVAPVRDVADDFGLAGVFPYRWGLSGDGLEKGGAVICGDLKPNKNADWKSGLFYVPFSPGAANYQILEEFDWRDARRLGCRLDGQVIAAVNGTVYVLMLDEVPRIYRVKPGDPEPLLPLELKPVPEEMRVRPPLPPLVTRGEYADLMAEVEGSSMPVELVGWKDALYLSLRSPSPGSGGTRWRLARIDPESGDVDLSVLESTANHLTMVPGPRQWAFAEKGRVRDLLDQDFLGLTLVPAERLEAFRPNLCH